MRTPVIESDGKPAAPQETDPPLDDEFLAWLEELL
jgi:hypothetical protein